MFNKNKDTTSKFDKQLKKDNDAKDKFINALQVSNNCKDDIIIEQQERIEALEEGLDYAKSNAGSTLGKLGHMTN